MTITNQQMAALIAIRQACKGLAGYVGEYPAGCKYVQGKETAILVQAADEQWEPMQGGQYHSMMLARVHVYATKGANPLKIILDLQAAVLTAVLTDVTLGGAVTCINPQAVVSGDWVTDFPLYGEGYNEENQHRTIEFVASLTVGG